jgi:hypothetical protein
VSQGLLSWLAGLEGVPDAFTWVGGGVVLTGIGLITHCEHRRGKAAEGCKGASPASSRNDELESGLGDSSHGMLEWEEEDSTNDHKQEGGDCEMVSLDTKKEETSY